MVIMYTEAGRRAHRETLGPTHRPAYRQMGNPKERSLASSLVSTLVSSRALAFISSLGLCITPLIFGDATSRSAQARPTGPGALCEAWPEREGCPTITSCDACHTSPPARDSFGSAIEALLWPGEARPESDEAFAEGVRSVLGELAALDSDGDGASNRDEWAAGSDPGDETSRPAGEPTDDPCATPGAHAGPDAAYQVCGYDSLYAYRRASIDLCGRSPSWEELSAQRARSEEERRAAIHTLADECLQSAHWLGREGTLSRIAHAKIRPLAALKSGADAGSIPLGDYDPDYALFSYALSGDRDARDLLLADYYVTMSSDDPPRYTVSPQLSGQNAPQARRAGMISSRWFFVINTMFTPIPRTTAAQAYRAYLGLDIAKSEGLIPPPAEVGELIDYDDKGITEPACAACHVTLDPLSYPFSRYEGIQGPNSGAYTQSRLTRFGPEEGERLDEVPESGAILGEEVSDLREWAEVAASSDEFAQLVARDLWGVLVGHEPRDATEEAEFEAVWRALRGEHAYRAERAVHDIIDTLSYGRP